MFAFAKMCMSRFNSGEHIHVQVVFPTDMSNISLHKDCNIGIFFCIYSKGAEHWGNVHMWVKLHNCELSTELFMSEHDKNILFQKKGEG